MNLSTVAAFKHIDTDIDGLVRLEGDVLKALQVVLTDMLFDIDLICIENNIDYCLGGGNCLGAIRHHGFIPWDDDVDINMARKDYGRFVDAFLERFGDKYWIHDIYRKDDYELCFPRIRRKGTVLLSREDFDRDECGVYVDVFLIDSVPNNVILRNIHGAGSLALGFLWSCRRFYLHRERYLELANGNEDLLKVFKRKVRIGKLTSFASLGWWANSWDRWNGKFEDCLSKYITVPVGRKHYFGELTRRDSFFPVRRVSYEGLELPVPNDAEGYLTRLYGTDYAVIPSLEDRETHVVYELNLGEQEPANDC